MSVAQKKPETSIVPPPDFNFGLATAQQAAGLTGLQFLQSILTGEIPAPPVAKATQQWIHEIGEGWAVFLGNPTEQFLNPLGLVHGGWAMTLLDSVLGCAIQTTLNPGETFATHSTDAKFIRPIFPQLEQVKAYAEVQSRGKNMATATGRIESLEGKLLATGTTSCFISRLSKV
ncbi:PaaI family thioesterase [Flexibacterium corallicola]|uniref:PaaI family thioesterase n=1 Tax=Flexibacterium corallicola TaxID=3037259 RepID=UPI00286F0F47|nr:PaaI family thioesterase [Pseudovibrio sp. M1P-2-3]